MEGLLPINSPLALGTVIQFHVDYWNKITESNESNNVFIP